MSKILPKLLVSFKDNVEKIKVAGKDLFSVKLEPVSEHGLSYLKHLLSEYDVTVARLKKKAEDLEWQSKHVDIIRTKLTNSDPSICWNDISKLEQVVLSLTPFLRRLSQLPGNIEALGGIIEFEKKLG